MRKVDPAIKIGIVMVPSPGTDVSCDWNRTVVHLAGASADFVVIHMYAPQHSKTAISENLLLQSMMVAPLNVEARLKEYHRMIQQQLGHDLPLAITEFNGALDESAAPYRLSFADALECADLLRVFLNPESDVAMASYWDFLNGPFGMLRTSAESASAVPVKEEPAFLLYEMWAKHFGSQLLKVDVRSPRADFRGAGSEGAARGDVSKPSMQLQTLDSDRYSSVAGSLWSRLLNVQIHRRNSDFTIHLQNRNRSIYPLLARFPRPGTDPGNSIEFSISFDAKFTPNPGSTGAPMEIGLMDSRGWNLTHSGIGLDTITSE